MNMIFKALLMRLLRMVLIPFMLDLIDRGSTFLNQKLKEFAKDVEA